MEEVSVHNEEKEIADHKNDDSFVCETEWQTVTLLFQELFSCREINIWLSYQIKNVCWLIFSFTQSTMMRSMLSIDENNPAVIQKNEELRRTLESSVLLDIVNPANPYIHVYMTKIDFLSLAPKTWLTCASIDACSHNYINWLIDERKKKEKIESIIAEKEIDLGKAKDNPCYDTMKAEWLKEKKNMTYETLHFLLISCHVLQSFLQGNQIKRRGFDGLHLWNRRTTPFTWRSNQNDFDCGVYYIKVMEWYDDWNEKKHLITTLSTKKKKDKEKHLENLRVKRVEKVFVEDEKIRKERERHEQE
ncbi:Orotidine 5'-phosphate decarboxylase, partial [Bienertia sinuspersici]